MPLWSRIVTEHEDGRFTVVLRSYTYYVKLSHNSSLCTGCGICATTCPKNAISVEVGVRDGSIKVKFSLDHEKCSFCGLCSVVCQFGAISFEHGKPGCTPEATPLLIKNGIIPPMRKYAIIDEEKCNGCGACAKVCSRNAILKDSDGSIIINRDLCIACGWCAEVCGRGAIKVEKVFNGRVEISPELCREGCHLCAIACPAHAIFHPEVEENKVRRAVVRKTLRTLDAKRPRILNQFCVLCGVCVRVCPSPGAIRISRESVSCPDVNTPLWNRVKSLLLTQG